MQKIFIILILLFFCLSGFSQIRDTMKIEHDTTEYEITVFDPVFYSWLMTNGRPRGFYGQPYLESHNRFYIAEWNSRVISGYKPNLYSIYIDYNPSLDYGYEVNFILFNYFQYFMEVTRERLGIRRRGLNN